MPRLTVENFQISRLFYIDILLRFDNDAKPKQKTQRIKIKL